MENKKTVFTNDAQQKLRMENKNSLFRIGVYLQLNADVILCSHNKNSQQKCEQNKKFVNYVNKKFRFKIRSELS